MNSGYDQFFKTARKTRANTPPPAPSASAKRSDNRLLTEQLRARMRPKMKRKPRPFPWAVGLGTLTIFVASLWGYRHVDRLDKWSRSIDISFLGKAIAEEVTGTPEKKSDVAEKPTATADDKSAVPETAKPEGSSYSTEQVDHFAKLNERSKEIDAREAEVDRAEQELKTQQNELDKRMKELESTRSSISKKLEDRVQADDKKVDTLVEVYSNMKPQQAAKVFETLDENLVVEILGRMKKKNAAEVMNLIKPEKAQILTEKYAGYKSK